MEILNTIIAIVSSIIAISFLQYSKIYNVVKEILDYGRNNNC